MSITAHPGFVAALAESDLTGSQALHLREYAEWLERTPAIQPLPFPAGPYRIEVIGIIPRIVDRKGRDVMREPGGMERLIACANAITDKVWYPQAHVDTTEAYIGRLKALSGHAPTEERAA